MIEVGDITIRPRLCVREEEGGAWTFYKEGSFELMQFTGLKDKNGVEIYEGDIVIFHQFTQELGENLGVMEGEKSFVAEITFDSMGVGVKNSKGEDTALWAYSGLHDESFEVIGNIHENPELVKP